MFLVVGSGPAGVSGAKALLRQGRRVTMIDVGLNLEPVRRALLDRIASREVEAWDPIEVAALKGHQPHDARGIQVKLAFGSDYPYRSATESLGLSIPDGTFKPSFARGGLSTVWGASAMPYNAHDLERWPITEQDLALIIGRSANGCRWPPARTTSPQTIPSARIRSTCRSRAIRPARCSIG